MTLYDVLGVTPSADDAQLRRAYLGLARRHHPDAGGGDSEAILRVNEAWSVLGDPTARAAYDAGLAGEGRSFVHPPAAVPFVPRDGDEEESDDWRYEPDVGDPRTSPGRRLLMVPMVSLWLAALCGGIWLVSPGDALIALTAILAAAAVLGFLVAPLVAMSKASQYERHD